MFHLKVQPLSCIQISEILNKSQGRASGLTLHYALWFEDHIPRVDANFSASYIMLPFKQKSCHWISLIFFVFLKPVQVKFKFISAVKLEQDRSRRRHNVSGSGPVCPLIGIDTCNFI